MKRRTYLAGSLATVARLAIPGGVATLAGCETVPGTPTSIAGTTMGTAYRVSLAETVSRKETESLRAGVESVLHRVDVLMSTYRTDSELSRFNASAANDARNIAPETATVIAEALRAATVSGGAFDATVGPLVDLWGFGPLDAKGVPDDKTIADARGLSGPDALRFDTRDRVISKLKDGLRLDLSGVAKGYAVDLVADYLDAAGIDHYLVDVGGELRARGRKADGARWRIGIERPIPGQRRLQRVVEIENGAIATSGDYRNFFERNGRRYSHTIDPRSGHPVTHALASVSVLADRAMTADALSTAMMVQGPEEGMAMADRLSVPALFLIRSETGIVERATRLFSERIVS